MVADEDLGRFTWRGDPIRPGGRRLIQSDLQHVLAHRLCFGGHGNNRNCYRRDHDPRGRSEGAHHPVGLSR